jgi:hypothetical protein
MITGVFKAGPTGIETMTPVLSLKTVPQNGQAKLITNECKDSIINVANFNPVDKGLESGLDYGVWVSTIESDTALKELSKSISLLRYKSDKRVTSGGGNIVKITQGALSGSLAQMCISGGEKKTITVTIDSMYAKADPATKTTYTHAIVDLVSNGLAGSFGGNCVVKREEGYYCVKLSDTQNLGSRRLDLESKDLILDEKGGCVNGTVYSTFPGTLNFDVEPYTVNNMNFNSIRQVKISANDSVQGPIVKPAVTSTKTIQVTTTTQPTTPIVQQPTPKPAPVTTIAKSTVSGEEKINKLSFAPLAPPTPLTPTLNTRNLKTDYYLVEYVGGNITKSAISSPIELLPYTNSKDYTWYRNVTICAYPTNQNGEAVKTAEGEAVYVQANGAQFVVSIRAGQENPDADSTKIIDITTGTIHPDDLVTQIVSGRLSPNKTYYFTIMWKGNPQTININAYKEMMIREGKLDTAVIAGNESTAAEDTARVSAKSASIQKYIMGCGITSLVCNSYAGPVNAASGLVFDCGTPLLGALREGFAASKPFGVSGKSVLEGVDSIVNIFTGLINTVTGVISGFPKIPQLKLATAAELSPTQWSTGMSIKQKTILEGAAAGAITPFLTTKYWGRYASGINKSNIDSWATEMARLNKEEAKAMLQKSISPAAYTANQTAINNALNVYANGIEEKLTKGLEKYYESTLDMKTASPLNIYRTNKTIYTIPENKIQDGITQAYKGLTEDATLTFESVLTNKTNGPSYIEQIFGTNNPAATKGMLIADSPLAKVFAEKFNVADDVISKNLSEVLTASGKLDTGVVKAGGISAKQAESIVSSMLEKTTPILSLADRDALAQRIVARMPVVVDPSTGANVVFTGRYVTTVPGTGAAGGLFTPGTAAITQQIEGDSISDIVAKIKSASLYTNPATGATVNDVTETIMRSGKLDGVLKEMAKNVDAATKQAAAEDISKLGGKACMLSKIKSLFTLRTLGYMGYGVGCGLAANAVGMYWYDAELDTKLKGLGEKRVVIGDDYLNKGSTYKVTITSGTFNGGKVGTTFTLVKDLSELKQKINGALPEKIVSPVPVDGKLPEQRELDVYPLQTSRGVAKSLMRQDVSFKESHSTFWKNHAIKDTAAVENTLPLVRYQYPELQKVIFNYTAQKGFDCKENPGLKKLLVPAEVLGVAEPWAIAIATTNAAVNLYNDVKVSKEAKGEDTWLLDKLTIALNAAYAQDSTHTKFVMNTEIAKKVFPAASAKDLSIFVDDVTFWEKAQSISPTIDFCPTN